MNDAKLRAVAREIYQDDLLAFFHDRLKVYLRDKGARHDLIDAVLAPTAVIPGAPQAREGDPGDRAQSPRSPSRTAPPSAGDDTRGGNDDLRDIVRRLEALSRFLDTEDGANLLAGTKRASNILRIEEKKDGIAYDGVLDRALLDAQGLPEEKALAEVLGEAGRAARERVQAEDYEGAMAALASLRPAVDAFFDKVTVNADDPALRANRLRLLAGLREATRAVADFSRIGG